MTRVIVVEDNKSILNEIHQWSTDLGLNIQSFERAESLYSFLVDVNQNADLFIIDDSLPGLSASALIQDIRATRRNKKVPIFLLCNEFDANYRDVSKTLGVNGWIEKPVKKEIFESIINAVKTDEICRGEIHEIDFTIHLGRLDITWDNGNRGLICSGMLNENSFFDRISYLVPVNVLVVPIDWSGVSLINVDGIKAWQSFLNTNFARQRKFVFHNCPVLMIEYMNAMPDHFFEHKQILIKSVYLPVFNHKEHEIKSVWIDLEQLNKYNNNVIELVEKQHPIKDKPLEYETDLLTYFSFLQFVSTEEVWKIYSNLVYKTDKELNNGTPASTEMLFWRSYLQFFRVINDCMKTEMLITRETILDQSSRILARFAAFDTAMHVLDPKIEFRPVLRDHVVEIILFQYKDLLLSFDSISNLIGNLAVKWRRKSAMEQRVREIDQIIYQAADVFCPTLSKYLIAAGAIKKETVFCDSLRQEDLIELTVSCLSAIKSSLVQMGRKVEQVGNQIIHHLTNTFSSDVRLGKINDGYDLSYHTKKALLKFQREALLTWQDTKLGNDLIKNVCDMLEAVNVDFQRIITSMMAHDLVHQVLKQRIFEIELCAERTDIDTFLMTIPVQFRSIIEEKLFDFCFPKAPGQEKDSLDRGSISFF